MAEYWELIFGGPEFHPFREWMERNAVNEKAYLKANRRV